MSEQFKLRRRYNVTLDPEVKDSAMELLRGDESLSGTVERLLVGFISRRKKGRALLLSPSGLAKALPVSEPVGSMKTQVKGLGSEYSDVQIPSIILPLLKVVKQQLPSGAIITPSKERANLTHPLFSDLIHPKKKLVKMFIRKSQEVVHVMCPTPLLEQLGYDLDENPDRDGDQKVIWSFSDAPSRAEQLGKNLATLI